MDWSIGSTEERSGLVTNRTFLCLDKGHDPAE